MRQADCHQIHFQAKETHRVISARSEEGHFNHGEVHLILGHQKVLFNIGDHKVISPLTIRNRNLANIINNNNINNDNNINNNINTNNNIKINNNTNNNNNKANLETRDNNIKDTVIKTNFNNIEETFKGVTTNQEATPTEAEAATTIEAFLITVEETTAVQPLDEDDTTTDTTTATILDTTTSEDSIVGDTTNVALGGWSNRTLRYHLLTPSPRP